MGIGTGYLATVLLCDALGFRKGNAVAGEGERRKEGEAGEARANG